MMSNSKVLTVSYGTFSCTLEGFDDSFDTMKAIAEYFRDLAADDRYFGAEPPQPDAEMLARIAEREISRRVEAQLSETGVHLRAGHAALPPAASGQADMAADDGSQTPGKGDVTEETAQDVAAELGVTQPSPATARVEPQPAKPEEGLLPPKMAQASMSYSAFSIPSTLPASLDTVRESPAEPRPQQPRTDEVVEPTATEDDAASFFAQRVEDEDLIPVAEDVPASEARPSPNSIAYKLQRIRAVASTNRPAATAYSEDEHADGLLDNQKPAAPISEVFQHDAESEQDPDSLSAPVEADPEEAEAQPIETAEPAPGDDTETPSAEQPDDEDAALAAALARLSEDFDTAGVAETADDAQSDEAESASSSEEDAGETDDFVFADDQADETATSADTPSDDDDRSDAEDTQTQDTPTVRARVIKVKRSALEAAINDGMLEEAKADRRWQRTEADDGEGTGHQPAYLLENVAAKEDELDRLMAEADHQMDEPEASSRRAAFDQMRGAVAASKADDKLSASDATSDSDYRSDLAATVKPRRPVLGDRKESRDARPAPLKLVAEQRIDRAEISADPVRPRRVAASTQERNEDDGGFAEYAEARGARELPELLEAAAAYITLVEGHAQFSRPQLMSKVLQLDPEGYTREDGLRHFGQLLRAGKIEKIDGGRFTATDDTGFRPDGTRAAG